MKTPITSPPTPQAMAEVSNSGTAAMTTPIKTNTMASFTQMLNDVLLSNAPYSAKYIELKKMGLSDLEIKKVLKQYQTLSMQNQEDAIIFDRPKAPAPQAKKSPVKTRKPSAKKKA